MPRPLLDAIVLVCGLVAAGSSVLAQEAQGLSDLRACRGENSDVALSFSFGGSACVEAEPARVESSLDGIAPVTIPMRSTAEICTMQLVPVEIAQTIAVDPLSTSLNVTVLDPEGRPLGTGSTDIMEGADCGAAPESQVQQ